MFNDVSSYRFKSERQWKKHLIDFSEMYLNSISYMDSYEDIESRMDSDFDRAIEDGHIHMKSGDIGLIPFDFEFGITETKSGRPVFFDYYLVVRVVCDIPEGFDRYSYLEDFDLGVDVDTSVSLFVNWDSGKVVEFLGYDF